ncbi:MAG: fatty acid desaturase [Kiritimatiellae bacterium]|nr:fatty acid desaturase [Kiritimatiellia bacterium]
MTSDTNLVPHNRAGAAQVKEGVRWIVVSLTFTPRSELADYEWDYQLKNWNRPDLDRDILKELRQRSTWNGIWRVWLFLVLLGGSAVATLYVSQYSLWLALPLLYLYYFFYGFWVAIAHELQHKTVFTRSLDGFSEILFFMVQIFIWNSPRYARISHRLHHRYTMVRGVDPETDWPEVITTQWLRNYLWGFILRILVVGVVVALYRDVMIQVNRIAGKKDRMMRDYCSDHDVARIRKESTAILFFHVAVVAAAIWFRRWEPIVFITLAWHIGSAMEMLWHQTEHIGRLYNVKDQRLSTRSVYVGPFVKLIYWGLDDHVDHHLFPAVPSRNLPKLHKILGDGLPEPKGMIACWREMFAIAREKDREPVNEFVPMAM